MQLNTFYLLILCSFFIQSELKINQPTKHALIIAIGDYDRRSGWERLSSENDLKVLLPALQYHGFKEDNISVLKNTEATKQNIVRRLSNLAKQVNKGDIVFIHYSGHGQQIQDLNGDEADGLDEALAPYDSRMQFIKGVYEGEKHLNDDEIGALLNNIRSRLGESGNVVFSVDACFSGTITRGEFAKTRGAEKPFTFPDYIPKTAADKSFTGIDFAHNSEEEMASLVVFSGSAQDESNWEVLIEGGESYGTLSYALGKELLNANTTKPIIYGELYERVRERMATLAPRQTPQIEGNHAVYLFSGQVNLNAVRSIVVTEQVSDTEVFISAGQLAGIREGCKIAIYPNASESSVATVYGNVTKSNLISAVVELDGEIDNDIVGKKVKIASLGTGNKVTKVFVEMFLEKEFEDEILRELDLPTIELTNKNPDLILTDTTYEIAVAQTTRSGGLAKRIRLYDRNARDLLTTTRDARSKKNGAGKEELIHLILDRIAAHHSGLVFRSLEIPTQEEPVIKIDYVPVDYRMNDNNDPEVFREKQVRTRGLSPEAIKGDVFVFRLSNTSDRRLYYNILEMSADAEVDVIVPNSSLSHTDRYIEPGESKLIDDKEYFFKLTDPSGPQSFKVIAADRPFNLHEDIEAVKRMSTSRSEPVFTDFTFITIDDYALKILDETELY